MTGLIDSSEPREYRERHNLLSVLVLLYFSKLDQPLFHILLEQTDEAILVLL